jgi:transporter family protein
MNWIYYAVTAALFMALYNVFIKLAAGNIHQVVGAVVLQVVAALAGAAMLLFLKLNGTALPISNKGLLFAALAGLSVGLAEIISFFAFSGGTAASKGVTVIVGSTIVLAVLIGLVFLKESLTPLQIVGVLLVLVGIGLVVK